MAQIVLNSALALLVAAAFLTTAAAFRGDDRLAQKVPVKAKNRHHPNR